MKVLKMTKNVLDRILLVSSLVLLALMVIVIIYQVFSRQLLGVSPTWSEELSRILFVWVSFFGIAYGFKEKLHIGVNIFVNMFPEKVQDVFDYFAKVLVIGFGILMIYYGWQFAVLTGGGTMPGLGVPSTVLYACIPIAGFFTLLNGIELLFTKGMHQKLDDDGEEA